MSGQSDAPQLYELLEICELHYGPEELRSARTVAFLKGHGWAYSPETHNGVYGNDLTEHWWTKGDRKEFASHAQHAEARAIVERIRGEVQA